MAELVDLAITKKIPNAFDALRLLNAASIFASSDGAVDTEQAAIISDKTVSGMQLAYAVGKGEITADEAVDVAIDRATAAATTVIQKAVSYACDVACPAIGEKIGMVFSPAGAAIGRTVGIAVGMKLKTPAQELVKKGMKLVKSLAKTVCEKLKEGAASIATKIWSFITA